MISALRLFFRMQAAQRLLRGFYLSEEETAQHCTQVCEEFASFTCNECRFKTVRDSEETAFRENTIPRGNCKKLRLLSPATVPRSYRFAI